MNDAKPTYRTKTGRILTDEEIEALAAEAEGGYDVTELARRPGRPRMGSAPATVVPVRLPADLHSAVKVLAEAECTSLSEVVRDALRRYLASEAPSLGFRTASGRVLTDAEIDALAAEAGAGYDVSALRGRPRRRGRGRAQVVPVRMPPELKAQVERRAEAESTSVSEVVREALRARLDRDDSDPPRGGVELGYDVFVSYARADRDAVQPLAQALRDHGLRVFVDDPEIDDFERITTRITLSLTASRVLLAYYSAAYPTRRACQWELTTAYLAAQRAGDPSRRILVLNPEPGLDHLHPGELRDALFRRPPTDGDQAALAELAQAVRGRVRELPGSLGEVAPLVPARWLPTQGLGSTRFVGRLPEMWRIHSALHPDTTRLTVGRAGPAVAQLRGLGGVGKSLLAEEYALRFGAAYPGGIYWLRADGSHDPTDLSPDELTVRHHDQLRRIAELVGIATEQLSPDQVIAAVAQAIRQADQPSLWVVDDLPNGLNAQQVRALVAPHPLARTLFTTRSQAYGALAVAIDLDVLAAQDAYQLLTTRRAATTQGEQRAAEGIVEALGRHALAVDVAGAALEVQQGLISYADFLTTLAQPDEDELELIVELADALPNGHEASITRTLRRSISHLSADGYDFLRLAALLASAPIPAGLVAAAFAQADGLDQQQAIRRAGHAIAEAAALSLTSKAGDDQTGTWLVHALVVRTIRFQEPDPQRLAVLRQAAIAMLTAQLQAIVDARAHIALEGVIPHARQLVGDAETAMEAELLGWVARYDHQRGDFGPAAQGYRQQADAHRRLLGPEHPGTLTSVSNLALTRHALGNLAEARDLNQQVLDARRRLLGPEHPHTLTSMSNLAGTLQALGDLGGARELHQHVLDAYWRLLGPEHPATLGAMNNLAGTLEALGDLAGARELNQQVVDGRSRLLGPEHPDTLTSMNNLAETFRALGDLVGARDLHEQVVEAHRRLLGPEHPATLGAINNLAGSLQTLGDLVRARELLEQVVDARRRLFGPEHPAALTSMSNLADTLLALGDLTSARDMNQQVLDVRRRLLGPEHPDTLTSINNLAETLRTLGDLAGARELLEQALEGRRRVLGPEHPDTLTSRGNLALTLQALGHPTAARELLEQVVEAQRRLLGPEHPVTLNSINNLAGALQALGDLGGARDLNQQVLETYRRHLGPEHPATLNSMNNLALMLQALGDLTAARELLEQVVEAQRRRLGPEHPATLISMSNLADTLRAEGELPRSRELLEQVVEAQRRRLGPEHLHFLTSMNNLAETLRVQGDLARARELLEQVVEAHQRLLGPDHPSTLSTVNNLALTLHGAGNRAGTRQLLEQVLEGRRRVLGPSHPDTLTSMHNLAGTLYDLGNLTDARDLLEQMVDTCRRILGPDHPTTRTVTENLAAVQRAIAKQQ